MSDPDTRAARPLPSVDEIQKLVGPLFPGLMGLRVVSLAPERVLGELLVRPDLCTTGGILHGGAYMAFADSLGAIGTVISLPSGKMTTTTDSSTKFISGAKLGTTVSGEAVALHRGRTTQVWQTSIRTPEGRLCAVVTQTQLIMDAR